MTKRLRGSIDLDEGPSLHLPKEIIAHILELCVREGGEVSRVFELLTLSRSTYQLLLVNTSFWSHLWCRLSDVNESSLFDTDGFWGEEFHLDDTNGAVMKQEDDPVIVPSCAELRALSRAAGN